MTHSSTHNNCCLEVSVSVSTQTTQPLSVILLTGEVFYGIVTSVGVAGEEYGGLPLQHP